MTPDLLPGMPAALPVCPRPPRRRKTPPLRGSFYGQLYIQGELFQLEHAGAHLQDEIGLLRVLAFRLMDQLCGAERYGDNERANVRLVIGLCTTIDRLTWLQAHCGAGDSEAMQFFLRAAQMRRSS